MCFIKSRGETDPSSISSTKKCYDPPHKKTNNLEINSSTTSTIRVSDDQSLRQLLT